MLTEHGGAASLAPVVLSREEAEALLDAEPGDEFNLSASEIDSFKTLKQTNRPKAIEDAVLQHYREILFQRFEAYRRGGTNAIAPYAREESRDSKPSLELRQAANASAILSRYFPALHKAWLDYPKALPPGADEAFPWVEKNVEGRPAVILRHRVSIDWNGGRLGVDSGVLCAAFLQFQPMDNRLPTVSRRYGGLSAGAQLHRPSGGSGQRCQAYNRPGVAERQNAQVF